MKTFALSILIVLFAIPLYAQDSSYETTVDTLGDVVVSNTIIHKYDTSITYDTVFTYDTSIVVQKQLNDLREEFYDKAVESLDHRKTIIDQMLIVEGILFGLLGFCVAFIVYLAQRLRNRLDKERNEAKSEIQNYLEILKGDTERIKNNLYKEFSIRIKEMENRVSISASNIEQTLNLTMLKKYNDMSSKLKSEMHGLKTEAEKKVKVEINEITEVVMEIAQDCVSKIYLIDRIREFSNRLKELYSIYEATLDDSSIEKIRANFERIIKTDSDNIISEYEEIKRLITQNKMELSKQIPIDVFKQIGRLYYIKGRLNEAHDCFNYYLEKMKNNEEIIKLVADTELQLQDIENDSQDVIGS